uniref:Palmitoyltransferase n=1 Tax=Steinernema glaseri TaxID=37863 RepID=A0A1I7XY62_9BILA
MANDKISRCKQEALLRRINKFLAPLPFFFINLLILVIICFEFLVVLPYEIEVRGFYTFMALVAGGIYIIVNIYYHLAKAAFTNPGSPRKSDQAPLCNVCDNYKPHTVHHCSICRQCVIRMDHHCLLINSCVGLHNHRHFFQFLAFLFLGCFYALLSGFYTIYYNIFT